MATDQGSPPRRAVVRRRCAPGPPRRPGRPGRWIADLANGPRIRLTPVEASQIASEITRVLYSADQVAARLPRGAANDRTVLIFCGDDEPEELGGQIAAELFEANGWTVRFAGGGVPSPVML